MPSSFQVLAKSFTKHGIKRGISCQRRCARGIWMLLNGEREYGKMKNGIQTENV